MGLIPALGRSLGGGNGNPLQYSSLGNPMDGGAWRAWGCKELDTTEHATFFNVLNLFIYWEKHYFILAKPYILKLRKKNKDIVHNTLSQKLLLSYN